MFPIVFPISVKLKLFFSISSIVSLFSKVKCFCFIIINLPFTANETRFIINYKFDLQNQILYNLKNENLIIYLSILKKINNFAEKS